MTKLSNSSVDSAEHDDEENRSPKPALSSDSQAFIGLKLRELYDDVVAEPVPDRFLELLGKLGKSDDTSVTE